jgi:hypothetical protein
MDMRTKLDIFFFLYTYFGKFDKGKSKFLLVFLKAVVYGIMQIKRGLSCK